MSDHPMAVSKTGVSCEPHPMSTTTTTTTLQQEMMGPLMSSDLSVGPRESPLPVTIELLVLCVPLSVGPFVLAGSHCLSPCAAIACHHRAAARPHCSSRHLMAVWRRARPLYLLFGLTSIQPSELSFGVATPRYPGRESTRLEHRYVCGPRLGSHTLVYFGHRVSHS